MSSFTPDLTPDRVPDAARERRPPSRADDIAVPLAGTAEWLVAELRDECSEIGVSIGATGREFHPAGFERGVHAFAREARRLGATPERMLVLLKECLRDERLPREDVDVYERHVATAVRTAITAYYGSDAGM